MSKGKFEAFREGLKDAFTGLLFTAVIVTVVGGTVLMAVERSAIYA